MQTLIQSSPSQVTSKQIRKCVVCRKKCNYQCPKCSVHYCSVPHYRSHNLFCTEQFYEKQVQEKLKNTKVTNPKDKKQTIELINEHRTLLQNQLDPNSIKEQRIEEILSLLESGEQFSLSEQEEKVFNQYTSQIQTQEQQYHPELQFWEIEDGMGLYLLVEPKTEIEDYNQSEHPNIILERLSFSEKLKEYSSHNHPTNPLIIYHAFQLAYLGVFMFRLYESDINYDFFLSVYLCPYNQEILKEKSGLGVSLLLSVLNQCILKTSKKQDLNLSQMIKDWLSPYHLPILIYDTNKICSKKFVLIELLLRVSDGIQATNSKQKVKVLKKIQFMITYLISYYNEPHDIVSEALCYLNEKQKNRQIGKQTQNIL